MKTHSNSTFMIAWFWAVTAVGSCAGQVTPVQEPKQRIITGSHTGGAHSVAFSPDGKILASVGGDGSIKLWNVSTGKNITSEPYSGRTIHAVAFSSDGKILASAGDDEIIQLWAVASTDGSITLKKGATLKGHSEGINAIVFSPDGKTLASGAGGESGEIKLWEVTTGKERATLKGHTEGVKSVAISSDGKTLASGSSDRTIRLWDLETGKELATLKGHSNAVASVAFSPDGKTLASGSVGFTDNTVNGKAYGEIKLWDVAKSRERSSLEGQKGNVACVAFSYEGKTLASASSDKTIILWDIATGKELKMLKTKEAGSEVIAWSKDGKFLASCSGWTTNIGLWDMPPE
jgi:WD40 repeat protein